MKTDYAKNMNIKNKKSVVIRLFKTLFEFYPVMLPVVIVCIIFNAAVSSIPSIFMQKIIAIVEKYWQISDWNTAKKCYTMLPLATFYILSL